MAEPEESIEPGWDYVSGLCCNKAMIRTKLPEQLALNACGTGGEKVRWRKKERCGREEKEIERQSERERENARNSSHT